MARIEEVHVAVVDDFDGTKAAETVAFSLDGKAYEIDLSKSNANELRRTLRPYVERARGPRRGTASGRGKRRATGGTGRTEGYDRSEVRAWAKSNRVRVAARGRIANDVVTKWRQATGN